MGRWLAGRLMKELGLVSCQQPTHRYKRGGHEHIVMRWLISAIRFKTSGEFLRIFSTNVRYEMTLLNFTLFA